MSISISYEARPTKGFIKKYFDDKKEFDEKYRKALADRFAGNDCLNVMYNHPSGRLLWTESEEKKCGSLYDNKAFKALTKDPRYDWKMQQVYEKVCESDFSGNYEKFCNSTSIKNKYRSE